MSTLFCYILGFIFFIFFLLDGDIIPAISSLLLGILLGYLITKEETKNKETAVIQKNNQNTFPSQSNHKPDSADLELHSSQSHELTYQSSPQKVQPNGNTSLEKNQAETKPLSSSPINQIHYTASNKVRAVILTKSGKFGGACVAGYDPSTRKFVRFVSDPHGKEIPFSWMNGISCMDDIEVEIIDACPLGPQGENVYIRPNTFKRISPYHGTIEDIRKSITYPDTNSLAENNSNRLFSISGLKHSLEIISVKNLVLTKVQKYDGTYTTRAQFLYNGQQHFDYRVTDFNYDLRDRKEKSLKFPYADLILSIPKEEFIIHGDNKGYYKFVAAIYPIEMPVSPPPSPLTMQQPTQNKDRKNPETTIQKNGNSNSYEPWTKKEEDMLLDEFYSGVSIQNIAEMHGRTTGAIRSRLNKLGVI